MEDDIEQRQKEKQNYLRKKILEKNLDSEKFVEFLEEKKGEEGADISNWTMDDLKSVVKEFYQINNIPLEELEDKDDKDKEDKIDFIIDEDSLMNLFQKKSNKEKEKTKPLFDFDKNFGKINEPEKKSTKENENNENIKKKEKEQIINNKEEKINDDEINDALPDDNKNDLKEKFDINDNILNENLTNIIDKNEHDEEYGIIIGDKVKCTCMESTEFRDHKDIRIEIKDPVKLEKKLFSGKSVNYSVITYPFNYEVNRRYSDFIWLREMLANLYNNILIPKMSMKGKVTKDKHDDNFIKKRMNFLERFINYIIKDETIKTSQILYDFLTIQKYEDFTIKKKLYEKIKIYNFIDIKERKSIDGELNIKVSKEKEIYLENIKDNTIYNGNLFKKLNTNFKSLNDELSVVIKRLEIISDIYQQIFDISNKYLDLNVIKTSYSQMVLMFQEFKKSLEKIQFFIKSEIKQHFKFIGNNFICLNEMIQNVDLAKYNYLKISKHLINKKNELYKKGDKTKYDINENINMNDKKSVLKYMLPQETINSIKNKMIYGFYLNEIIKEYEKMRKINSYFNKRKICYFCKEQITICSEYTRILGDIIMTIDCCKNI